MSERMPSKFRDLRESDRDFVFDSWLKEYRQSAFGRQIQSDVFYPGERALINEILSKSSVTIVCNQGDENQIYGYAVHRQVGSVLVLSWIFVKGIFRGLGFGRALWDEIGKPDVVTHLSRQFNGRYDQTTHKYVSGLPDGVIYNPYLDLRS